MLINELVWTEKYRPRTLEELIISEKDMQILKSYIGNPQSMPNILLVGKPGSGKTSFAKMIPTIVGCVKGDYISMNSSDDRKIESIRNRIVPFLLSKGRGNTPKFIHMDEFDGTRGEFQDALRTYMEGDYNKNCKFILTANRINSISEAIQERCIIIDLANVDKELLIKRMKDIATKEGVKFDENGMKKLIDINYPSRRKMVATLQKNKDVGIYEHTVKSEIENGNDFYNILIKKESGSARTYTARKFIIENGLDCRDILKYTLFEMLLNDKTTTFPTGFKYKISQKARVIDHAMADGADSEIQMWGFITYFVAEMM